MIKRDLEDKLLSLAKKMPVIAILGPRQSGKTTLSQDAFKNHKYLSLEKSINKDFAMSDPRGFLESHENKHGLIIDEIQEVPKLLSEIQVYVDENDRPGYIVITGSQNFLINQAVSQTLAGRVAIFTLLPLSLNELMAANTFFIDDSAHNVSGAKICGLKGILHCSWKQTEQELLSNGLHAPNKKTE